MSRRRNFSAEFTRAVELVPRPGVSWAQVAPELGIGANLLSRWNREAKAEGGRAFGGTGSPGDEEMVPLKRDLTALEPESN
jgi:transposase